MDAGWEVYSKMVLQQLEDLSASMKDLRTEIKELKTEIAEIRGRESNIQELKNWKDKIDEITSPTQLQEMKKEVEELEKYLKQRLLLSFAVVQF